jgi:hypothetical protein
MPYNSSHIFGQTLWVAQVGSTLDVMSLGIDTMFNRKGEIKRQYHMVRISGWWFGTFFIFPYIENNHPN